jgi:sigma-B regulation protein RsbU (phosphoserine phosphatase)
LALYTDGLTESFNEDGQEFGEERLAESLRVHAGKAPSVMVASIVEDVKTFSPEEQYDDITLIVAKCR